MDEYSGPPGKATFFFTLDASSGYRKVEIEDANKSTAAFTSCQGLYRFIRMKFGSLNVTDIFRSNADIILSTVWPQLALECLDDIVNSPKSSQEHNRYVRAALILLHNVGVILKLKKC